MKLSTALLAATCSAGVLGELIQKVKQALDETLKEFPLASEIAEVLGRTLDTYGSSNELSISSLLSSSMKQSDSHRDSTKIVMIADAIQSLSTTGSADIKEELKGKELSKQIEEANKVHKNVTSGKPQAAPLAEAAKVTKATKAQHVIQTSTLSTAGSASKGSPSTSTGGGSGSSSSSGGGGGGSGGGSSSFGGDTTLSSSQDAQKTSDAAKMEAMAMPIASAGARAASPVPAPPSHAGGERILGMTKPVFVAVASIGGVVVVGAAAAGAWYFFMTT